MLKRNNEKIKRWGEQYARINSLLQGAVNLRPFYDYQISLFKIPDLIQANGLGISDTAKEIQSFPSLVSILPTPHEQPPAPQTDGVTDWTQSDEVARLKQQIEQLTTEKDLLLLEQAQTAQKLDKTQKQLRNTNAKLRRRDEKLEQLKQRLEIQQLTAPKANDLFGGHRTPLLNALIYACNKHYTNKKTLPKKFNLELEIMEILQQYNLKQSNNMASAFDTILRPPECKKNRGQSHILTKTAKIIKPKSKSKNATKAKPTPNTLQPTAIDDITTIIHHARPV